MAAPTGGTLGASPDRGRSWPARATASRWLCSSIHFLAMKTDLRRSLPRGSRVRGVKSHNGLRTISSQATDDADRGWTRLAESTPGLFTEATPNSGWSGPARRRPLRWITFGLSNRRRLLAVAHTEEGD